jgi:hypothetical protein
VPHLCGFHPGICLTTEEKRNRRYKRNKKGNWVMLKETGRKGAELKEIKWLKM